MGHCSSYDDVEVIKTVLAQEIKSPGVFVQFAADNNNLNKEMLDGKQTTHATTIVACQ